MIYQTFNSGDIVAGRTQTVSSGFFVDGNYSISQNLFTTSSTQAVPFGSGAYAVQNGLYYLNVYYQNQVHFSIAYGNQFGNGSSQNDLSTSQILPFVSNYQSYVNLLLDPSQKAFSFLSGSYNISSNSMVSSTSTGSSIFAITFEANLFKNQINPGQLQFSLSGSNGVFTFIDDSGIANTTSPVYNIISGSIINSVPTPYNVNGQVAYQSLGLFYPKNGIVILNVDAINNLIGLPQGVDSNGNGTVMPYSSTLWNDQNTNPVNAFQLYQSCLFNSIVGAGAYGANMYVVKSEAIPTTQYYVRVQNANFNYTNNPTFVSDGTDGLTKGTIKIPALRTNPTTYITTIGLYDASNELVAVAKLSQPLPKSFDNEYLIKVNLAY
jgi:hypothetical protein